MKSKNRNVEESLENKYFKKNKSICTVSANRPLVKWEESLTDEHAQCDFSGDTVDTGQVSQI